MTMSKRVELLIGLAVVVAGLVIILLVDADYFPAPAQR